MRLPTEECNVLQGGVYSTQCRPSTAPGVLYRPSTAPGVLYMPSTAPGVLYRPSTAPGVLYRPSTAPVPPTNLVLSINIQSVVI